MKFVCSVSKIRPTCCSTARLFSASHSNRDTEISPPTHVTQQEKSSTERRRRHAPKKRILSGIQPTGVPHLGNYLGALRRWKSLQDERLDAKRPKNHQLLFAIADLHALTAKQDPATFQKQRTESFASLLAVGLDPKHSILFMQSAIPYHTELMWIFSTIASMGYLSRMTQWKSKLGLADTASMDDKVVTQKLKLGLFSYPVLQAADILLYLPDLVPVGEDQAQHVEFTRSVARSFNAHYCPEGRPFFREPSLLLSPAKRIMSLKEPIAKMSKSHQDPMSRILITDTREEIQNKIRGALTDSIEGITYDPASRPGVSNLIEILKHTSHSELTLEEIAAENTDASMRSFKELVANSVAEELQGIRERFYEVTDPKNPTLRDALLSGNTTAAAIAGNNISKLKQLIGLDDGHLLKRRQSKSARKRPAQTKKAKVQQEQVKIEEANAEEPDVLPQQKQGVDQPIAS